MLSGWSTVDAIEVAVTVRDAVNGDTRLSHTCVRPPNNLVTAPQVLCCLSALMNQVVLLVEGPDPA